MTNPTLSLPLLSFLSVFLLIVPTRRIVPNRAQEDSPPDRAQVEATVAQLEETLAEGSVEESLEALLGARKIPHPKIIESIEKHGTRHDDPKVKSAAIEALGHIHHPAALKALHKAHKREKKKLDDDPLLHATLMREIARHGDESSLDILTDNLFARRDKDVIRTRILGLGKIRSKKSVDELIRLMRSTKRGRANDYLGDFRLSLVVLTGVDKGSSSEQWINWYGDSKRSLVVSEKLPSLSKSQERRWTRFWGESTGKGGAEEKDRKKRKRDARK